LAFIEQYPERQDHYQEYKSQAWESFYAQSPAQSTTFIISALNHLLTITAAATSL
jgi:phosphorylase kinase alpha/beta subunit